jgi:hypothetical protein
LWGCLALWLRKLSTAYDIILQDWEAGSKAGNLFDRLKSGIQPVILNHGIDPPAYLCWGQRATEELREDGHVVVAVCNVEKGVY